MQAHGQILIFQDSLFRTGSDSSKRRIGTAHLKVGARNVEIIPG